MPEVHKRHGMFTWVDLSSPDPDAAKGFYSGLFGWEARDVPIDDDGNVYTMLEKSGRSVAGLSSQPQAMRGAPAMWFSYVKVDDLDAVAARVPELGGTVAMAPMDVLDQGRMAMVQDPTGATLCLWQDGDHAGAEVFNEPGSLSWNELATPDLDAAKSFYADLLGWTIKTADVGGGFEYTTVFLDDDHSNGGMMEIGSAFPPGTPAHWSAYFTVEDVDATVAKAQELGGSVVVEPMDMAVGRMATIADPHGGTFTVFAPGS